MVRHLPTFSLVVSVTSLALFLAQPASAETVTLGIGTQDTTTNTVTAGVVIRQLHLLEKYLPKDGKYANIKFELEWQNFTSGPPVTNAMMANKLQIGMMGDYPLIVNGFTFESNPESKSRLIGVAAYSLSGSGNGIVVHKDSPYYDLADLKGKLVSVPFGSAAHGMVLKAMQDRGYAPDFFQLVSQSPEVGSTISRRRRSTPTPTSSPSPSCFLSAASRERFSTASRPTCRPSTVSWFAPISRKNIRKSSSPT